LGHIRGRMIIMLIYLRITFRVPGRLGRTYVPDIVPDKTRQRTSNHN
jgi:hypothetical protein